MADRKVAIVTGAASGMGRAMALALSQVGFDVAAVDRNTAALDTLPAPIRSVAADLSQADSFEKIVSAVLSAFGRIDVLINNAGIGQAANPERPTEESVALLGSDAGAMEPVPSGERNRADHAVSGGATAYAESEQRPDHYGDDQSRDNGARGVPAVRVEQGKRRNPPWRC